MILLIHNINITVPCSVHLDYYFVCIKIWPNLKLIERPTVTTITNDDFDASTVDLNPLDSIPVDIGYTP